MQIRLYIVNLLNIYYPQIFQKLSDIFDVACRIL